MSLLKSIKLQQLQEIIKADLVNKRFARIPFRQVCTDSRQLKKGDIFFAFIGDRFNGHNFVEVAVKKGASCVVVSRDIDFAHYKVPILKVSNAVGALGKIAQYCRDQERDTPLIAVTGSTGKTTTKEIIADILCKKYKTLKNFGTHNNFIGVPATVLKSNKKHDIGVLELGTNHFGEISYLAKIVQPQVAVLTNVGPSHLEFLRDEKGVLKEKSSVIKYLEKPKVLLINNDDPHLRKIKVSKETKVFTFGVNRKSDFMAEDIEIGDNFVSFRFKQKYTIYLNTLGKFNIYNALAGIGCGLIFGIGIRDIMEALQNFQFPSQRLKKIKFNSAFILDDTYNSNPLSLRGAINTLSEFKTRGRRILVMGDMLELGKKAEYFHRQIGSIVAKRPIDIFVTFGELSKSAADAARKKSNNKQEVFSSDSYIEVEAFLRERIQKEDVLLVKGSRFLKMENIITSLTSS